MRHLADLLEADLHLAVGDDGADEYAGRRLLELGFDLGRDAEFFEHADDVDAARAGGIADRFGREQGLFERIDRADVRFRRAFRNAGAHARFG